MKKSNKTLKNSKEAITLISLVITIIVLLIVAGISIALLTSENGILNKSTEAKQFTEKANDRELLQVEVLGSYDEKININVNKLIDNLENAGVNVIEKEFPLVVELKSGKYIIKEDGSIVNFDQKENKLGTISINKNIDNLNTSAKIKTIQGRTITIDGSTLKQSEITSDFKENDQIMIYASNSNTMSDCGKYEIYTIKSISNDKITMNKSINEVFNENNCQIVKLVNCEKIIIEENVVVKPSAYDGKCGGIVAIVAEEIVLSGKIDASKCGYDNNNISPNSGNKTREGNLSHAGGSNKYKGGNGGKNYQGFIGQASNSVGISDDILNNNQMTFGGGSISTKGGGIIYIDTQKIEINSQYALSSNGAGGYANGLGTAGSNIAGGEAGGTIVLRSKEIVFNTENKDYFVGANGGSGATEGRRVNNNVAEWPKYIGIDGNNIKGADAPDSNSGKKGGLGIASNGRRRSTIWEKWK